MVGRNDHRLASFLLSSFIALRQPHISCVHKDCVAVDHALAADVLVVNKAVVVPPLLHSCHPKNPDFTPVALEMVWFVRLQDESLGSQGLEQ